MAHYAGSCHCGAISLTLHSEKSPEQLGARTCQCSFCQKHGGSWTSDPQGQVEITLSGPVSRYRFGTKTADFLVCATCGVVSAVVGEIERQLRGAVRINCLEQSAVFLEQAAPIDFDGEILDSRLDRRAKSWTPAMIKDKN